MKYEVEITRIGYSTVTFGVEAETKKEAKRKALDKACNYSFSEDDADYEVNDCYVSELSDEEWEDEFGD